ncbi:hypothetical protein NPIL_159961 [Nephila pilipes]|uniref:Uncharacterized protein n=1 Tax=Nephila pilipes TaxID=299642 RepID=A0A8X6TJ73_NEPPI|nr:hypothetical protein NPIL_159961 [Nephila pilipes]
MPVTSQKETIMISGVIVCGDIVLNGRTEFHIFDINSVTGDTYCKEVIVPNVRLFRGAIGPDFVSMEAKHGRIGLLMFSSYRKMKISLEENSQCSPLI